MSSQFNLTQPLFGTTNTNLAGTSSNTLATGLNSQEAFQNTQITNFQPLQNVDSAITILHLTTLIPQWKGHFDIIEKMILSLDQSITSVEEVIAQMDSNLYIFLGTYSLTKGMLNNITIHQIIFFKEVNDMLAHHHVQNWLTVRARRQCESAVKKEQENEGNNHQVPNNLSVELSKKMVEMVRKLIDKINDVNEEVKTLMELDLLQVPNYINSVVESSKTRIIKISEKLTDLLNDIDYRKNSTRITDPPLALRETAIMNGKDKKDSKNTNKNGYELILGNPVKILTSPGNQSELRKRFMDALGIKQKRVTIVSEMNQVKMQIRYLRKFNTSYDDKQLPSLKDKGINITDILGPMQQNQTMLTQGARPTDLTGTTMGSLLPSGGGTGIFGATTGTGTSNLFGSTTSGFGTTGATTGSSNLFGTTGTGTSNLFGTGAGTTTGTSNLFGTTSGTTTGTSNLFGGTSTGASNLFGSTTGTTTGTSNLFGSTPGTTTGTSGLFGTTPTTTGTTGTSNLFGTTSGTTGLFGTTSTTPTTQFGSTTTGFGASTFGAPSQTTTGSTFGGGSTSGFGTTGATTGSSNLFGTTGTGTSNLFGTGAGTTTGTSNLFGTTSGTTTGTSNLFGGTSTGASNLFGSTNTGPMNQFGAMNAPGTTNMFGGNPTGSTSLFGASNPGSNSLFGPVKNTTTDSNFFGKGSTSSSSLFGSNTKQKVPGTDITVYQPPGNFGGFNQTQK
nr:hypothetical protein MACL_00001800 [Theileria orientalis]